MDQLLVRKPIVRAPKNPGPLERLLNQERRHLRRDVIGYAVDPCHPLNGEEWLRDLAEPLEDRLVVVAVGGLKAEVPAQSRNPGIGSVADIARQVAKELGVAL